MFESIALLAPTASPASLIGCAILLLLAVKAYKCHTHGGCSRCCHAKEMRLQYFDIPGRAEMIRLALAIGKLKFKDERLSREAWKEGTDKATTPFGQLPVLFVDGEPLAQSHAILRFVGRLARLYPCSAFKAAKADEIVFLVEDMFGLLAPTFSMDEEAKIAARKALVAGKLGEMWARLDAILADKEYFVADRLTVADVAVFSMAGTLASGWLSGVDKGMFRAYPRVQAHREMMAALPQVREFYAGLSEGTKEAYTTMGIDVAAYSSPAKQQQGATA